MIIKKLHTLLFSLTLSISSPVFATEEQLINDFCNKLSDKLGTVTLEGCNALELDWMGLETIKGNPLTHKEVLPKEDISPTGKVLFIGGVHGDEFASISLTYLWLQALLKPDSSSTFHWLFLPSANPDGLFAERSTRQNGRGTDINRNFPSPDWDEKAFETWKNHYNSDKRRYPGEYANSEIETQWIVNIIQRFQPDAIIALHAPFRLLDYDGPAHAQPNKIGHLEHRSLGTYPGSLGRYAGEHLNIPVLTIELGSSGKLPKTNEIKIMLKDLEKWVSDKIEQRIFDM